jgi:hypothetical protein
MESLTYYRKKCKKESKAPPYSGLNSVVIISKTEEVQEYYGQPCLAFLNRLSFNTNIDIFMDWPLKGALLDNTYRNEKNLRKRWRVYQKDYLIWLTCHSAWANAFITKSPQEMITKAVLFNTNYPAVYILQANKLLRALSEFNKAIKMWHKLKRHCEPHIALMLSYNVKQEKNHLSVDLWEGIGLHSGHAAFDKHNMLKKDSLLNQISHNPNFSGLPSLSKKLIGKQLRENGDFWDHKNKFGYSYMRLPKSKRIYVYKIFGDKRYIYGYKNAALLVRDFLIENSLQEFGYDI